MDGFKLCWTVSLLERQNYYDIFLIKWNWFQPTLKPFSYSFTLAVSTKTLLWMTAAVNWSAHTALSTWITAQWPTRLTTTYLYLLDSWTRRERHCFTGAPVQGVMKTLGCRDQHSCPRAALLILLTIFKTWNGLHCLHTLNFCRVSYL